MRGDDRVGGAAEGPERAEALPILEVHGVRDLGGLPVESIAAVGAPGLVFPPRRVDGRRVRLVTVAEPIGRGHKATDEQAAPWRDGRR